METKWTPGPWRVCGPDEWGDFDVVNKDDWVVGAMAGANAHLIAAAPDLYETLEKSETMLRDRGLIEMADEARAALAKANNTYSEMHMALSEANDKLAKAVEALEFYANKESWISNTPYESAEADVDESEKARTTLAELKGEDRG